MAEPDVLEAVERSLSAEKYLYGEPPEFGPTALQRKGTISEASWPLVDGDGILTQGHLRLILCVGGGFTICVIFAGQCVVRLDFTDALQCHPNPHWAWQLGLPALVCGPHIHRWSDNKSEVLNSGKTWDLPCRAPLPPQIRRFDQAFPWLASEINLVLSPEQREFELPAQFA